MSEAIRELLNGGEFFDVATNAADGIDIVLALKPDIPGLQVQTDLTGFTYREIGKGDTSGSRRPLDEDSGFSYSFIHAGEKASRLDRVDLCRIGHELFLTYNTVALSESVALQKARFLGALASAQAS